MKMFPLFALAIAAVLLGCQSPLTSTETNASSQRAANTPTSSSSFTPSTDYTQEVVAGSTSDQIIFRFTSNVGSHFVDLHYRIDGGTLQNFRMNQEGTLWTQSARVQYQSRVEYFFTYDNQQYVGINGILLTYFHTTTPILYGYVQTLWYVPDYALKSCTLNLQWATPDFMSNIDHYEIYVSDAQGNHSTFWTNWNGNSFSTSWTPNGTMSFFVRAVDSGGSTSARSEVLTLTY